MVYLLAAALLPAAWAGAGAGDTAPSSLPKAGLALPAPSAPAAFPAPPPPSAAGAPAESDTRSEVRKVEARVAALLAAMVNLPGDLNRLEQDIFRAGELGPEFVRNSARGLSADLRRYAADSRNLSADLQRLRTAGKKSAELDAAAAGLYAKARLLLSAARYQVQPAAEKTLWALRSAGGKELGETAVWEIVELSRQAGELNWNARDIQEYAGNLWVQVYPGPGSPAGAGGR
jgi:hypothetical protein